jgi:uncharacterized membrane protein YozB (DUF420 family)
MPRFSAGLLLTFATLLLATAPAFARADNASAAAQTAADARRARAMHSPLPPLNAALNASAALCLTAGYVFIRRGQRAAHRAAMLLALACSTLFLVFYLVHHAQVGSVRYAGDPAWRSAYLALLLSHTVLAAAIVPLALTTFARAWRGRFSAHRRIARWTLPLWLYVSATGVIIYFVLYRL